MNEYYNSLSFLDYLCNYGLNLNDNYNILELFQSAGCSLSQHLINNFNLNQYFCFSVDQRYFINSANLIVSYYEFVKLINYELGKNIYTFEHDTVFEKDFCLIKKDK